jgi:hypothetical protein
MSNRRVLPYPGGFDGGEYFNDTEELPPYGGRTDSTPVSLPDSSAQGNTTFTPNWDSKKDLYRSPPGEAPALSIPAPHIASRQGNGDVYTDVTSDILDGYQDNHYYRRPNPSHRARSPAPPVQIYPGSSKSQPMNSNYIPPLPEKNDSVASFDGNSLR